MITIQNWLFYEAIMMMRKSMNTDFGQGLRVRREKREGRVQKNGKGLKG